MNINDIQDLIKFVAKAGVNEVEIEKKDFKIFESRVRIDI